MIEIPESITIAGQLNETVKGKKIIEVKAAHTPHSFAWYAGEPSAYAPIMEGKRIGTAAGIGLANIPAGQPFSRLLSTMCQWLFPENCGIFPVRKRDEICLTATGSHRFFTCFLARSMGILPLFSQKSNCIQKQEKNRNPP